MNLDSWLAGLPPGAVLVILLITLIVEGTGMPWVPYEPVFVVVGQMVVENRLNAVAAVLLGAAANVTGNLLGYLAGARVGRTLVARYGHRIHLGPKELRTVEAWFGKYGAATALIGRFFGVIRTPAIIGAGLAGMDLRKFVAYSVIGSLFWTAVWVYGAVAVIHLIPPQWRAAAAWLALLAGFTVFLVPPLAGRMFRNYEKQSGE